MRGRHLIASGFLLLCLQAWAFADDENAPRGTLNGIVSDKTLGPLSGATVILTTTGKSSAVIAGFTNAEGRFQFPRLPVDTYAVLAVFGESRVMTRDIAVTENATATIQPVLDVGAEVITINEEKPLASAARPIKATIKRVLPWSDQAIDEDLWAVGWLLLDIDAQGKVTAFRFLRRPGIGLDEIARQEAWKLRFDPARDVDGKAVASQLLWKMEWPAYWWYHHRYMNPTPELIPYPKEEMALNAPTQAVPQSIMGATRRLHGVGGEGFILTSGYRPPPCKGSGPLNLDLLGGPSSNQHYRDCSPPDLEKAMTEPLMKRQP